MIKHIVLDLDHTLIHALDKDEANARRDIAFLKRAFKHHITQQYIIFERPHLGSFIRAIASKYKISVWTAASRTYGAYIIKHVIEPYLSPKTQIHAFLHSENCEDSLRATNMLKHLDILHEMEIYGYGHTFNRRNTVIIDDNPDILAQNNHVILIKPFEFDINDNELGQIWEKIQLIQ